MNLLDAITALSPLFLAALLIWSNRNHYRREMHAHNSAIDERNEAIIGWHACRKKAEEMQKEIDGLRWLISTYGIAPPANLPALTPAKPPTPTPPTPPTPSTTDANPTRAHLESALRQENENLAFLKTQIARYGDSDLARHNQVEAIEARILELERILDEMK